MPTQRAAAVSHLPAAAQPFVLAVHADDGHGFAGGWVRDEVVWAVGDRLPRQFDAGGGRWYEVTSAAAGAEPLLATRLLATPDGRHYLAPLVHVIEKR